MRVVLSVLSLLFVGIFGCSTIENPPSESTSIGEIAVGGGQSLVCPDICGPSTETLCQLPDGSCTVACNSCLCVTRGGKAVTSCHGRGASQASTSQVSTGEGGSPVGGTCGDETCGKGSFCCNASCGISAALGGVCTQQVCNTAG